jgi:hypothetical protein
MLCASFRVSWSEANGTHTFTATQNATGKTWTVTGQDPIALLAELQRKCGFEDMDQALSGALPDPSVRRPAPSPGLCKVSKTTGFLPMSADARLLMLYHFRPSVA